MEITDVTNKRNTIDDIIIEEEFIEEKEYTEEEQIRMGYASAYPEDYVDDTITINAFYLGEMDVNEHKEKKNGGEYHSSKCVLQCYNDAQEVKIPFFIENFKNYDKETDILKIQGNNVLARLIKKLKDGDNNKFTVKFEDLRELINNTHDIEVTVKQITKYGGFKECTIE